MERIGIYLRLSKEDEFIADESNSIVNQRKYIRAYVNKDKDLRRLECVEYSDDGYSGKNMDRPGMQNMLEHIKNNQLTCIIVKDFSRFSRDHIEQGKYIEQIFPFMGVRFISINDNYDSNDHIGGIGEIDISFKTLLYDFYSEDLSDKVKTSLSASRSNGNYIAAYAPYGYVKDPSNKHQLIIDEVASKIVKRIFKEYLSGNSMYRIACNLNTEEVMTPGVYIARQDGNEKMLQRYTERSPHWSAVAIKRILENQQYTGAMIYNRFESKAVGSRSCITLSKDEWKCVEGCHKAIISKKDFEKTAEILKQNSKNVMDGNRHEKHCLTGKIICGDCGHSMAHTYAGRPKHYCKSRYLDPGKTGCNFNIIDAEIESVILKMLQQYTDAMVDSRSIIDFQRNKEAERLQNAEKHLADMEHTRELMQEDLRASYEAYRSGTTNKETYLEQKQMYEQLEEKLQENILKQQDAIKHITDLDVPEVAGLEMLDGKIQLKKLTREMVDTFIDKIVVYGEKEIEVKWKFGNSK